MTSVSCASSVSGHKLTPTSQTDNRSKSCDTNCTSNSSCFFKRRKPMNPLAYPMRPTHQKNTNPVKQRVMSAKLLKLRQLQSQLNDANFHLAEVARENQILKTLQKRQDKALSKYENTNADLPRLIHSHEEEIRVLTEKNKTLKRTVKDLMEQQKQKEDELNKVREQLAHLEKLNKDKHLTVREKLTEQMEDYKVKLQKSEEQVTTLNRKLMLESKTSKQRLNAEIMRHKQCQKELLHAFEEIDRLTALLDTKENTVRPRNPRFTAALNHQQPTRTISKEKINSQPVTEVKLEPIVNGKDNVENGYRKNQNGFKIPMDNIKQRLSSGSLKLPQELNGSSNHSSEVSSESRDHSAGSFKSRPNSSLKLEKLPAVSENQKIKAKMKNDIGKKDVEKNKEIQKEDSEDSAEEYLEEKDLIVKYDSSKKLQDLHNGVISDSQLSNTDEEKIWNKNDLMNPRDHSDNSSEEDFLNTLSKLKSIKKEEEELLGKPHGYKRKSIEETNMSESLEEEERDVEKMADNLDNMIQRASQNSKEEFDKNLSGYCSDVLSSVKSCGKAIEAHKDSLKQSKKDTTTILDTLRETQKIETKLKKSFFNAEDDSMDFVKEILNEEHKFQVEQKAQQKSSLRDKNSNIEKKSLVNLENKKKLLATLRAIDNGDSVESIEEPKQTNVIKELFGHIAH